MNNTLARFLRDEYQEFCTCLTAWGVDEETIREISERLKPVHKKFISVSCAATVLSFRLPRSEYIKSLVGVNQLAIVLAIKGAENPMSVLLRQAIELVLKHIYFLTHPTEYQWTKTRDNFRELSFQSLLDYLCRLDEFKQFEGGKRIQENLTHSYSVLSRYVHVHSKKFNTYDPNEKLGATATLDKLVNVTDVLWPSLTTLLLLVSSHQYHAASSLEQSIILSSLPNDLRRDVKKHLRG